MTLSNTMTSLMDKARELTGLSEKISLSRLTELMNHFDLHVNPNLLGEAGTTLAGSNVLLSSPKNIIEDGNVKTYTSHGVQWDQVIFLMTLDPGTYTYSAYLKGPLDEASFYLQNSTGTQSLIATLISLANDNKWYRCKQTFSITNKDTYRIFFTNVYEQKNAKLELGDLATPLTTVGGRQVLKETQVIEDHREFKELLDLKEIKAIVEQRVHKVFKENVGHRDLKARKDQQAKTLMTLLIHYNLAILIIFGLTVIMKLTVHLLILLLMANGVTYQ